MYNYGSYIFASFLIGVSLSIQLTATHAFTITPTTTTTTATRYYNSAVNTAVVTTYNSRSRSIRNNRRASLQQQRLQPLGVVSRNGLIYEDIEIGTGRNIFPGDSILCYYIGTYQSTTKGGNNPFSNNNKKVTFDETDAGEPVSNLFSSKGCYKRFTRLCYSVHSISQYFRLKLLLGLEIQSQDGK